MKLFRLLVLFLLAISLMSCVTQSIKTTPSPQAGTVAVPPVPPVTVVITQTGTGGAAEEALIRELVYNFGKRLQNVSLLAPDAAQQIQNQYAEFVSPALLEMWMNDLSVAPGRMVSSPWPDRIEIISLEWADADTYEISGSVIEVTSEVVNGGEAGRVLVHIVVERSDGGWWITEYSEEQ